MKYFDVVFDGPPGPEAGRFVECEDPEGKSFNAGEWIDRGNGLWGLRILNPLPASSCPGCVNGKTYSDVDEDGAICNECAGTGRKHHPDDRAVDLFAQALKEKLAKKRIHGYHSWEKVAPAVLSQMLRDHIAKGDPIDVGNFCMMLFNLNEGITQRP